MNILFMCTYNSCRSQMAEGLARKILPPDFNIYSAGLYNAGINPTAAEVMMEIGIDISNQWSKTHEQVPLDKMDMLITLCDMVCPLNLPLSKKAKRIHWPTIDPVRTRGGEKEVLASFRRVRDELKERLTGLKKTLAQRSYV